MRNARSGRGEIDLVVRFGSRVVAVEVKTRREGGIDPIEAFTPRKARIVRQAARRLIPQAHRVDLVAVTVGEAGIDIRWLPEVA
jgi:Holliday junction resolvase-like predicted endonuclease